MIRFLIAGALAAFVALSPSLAAQSVRPEPECIRGTAEGRWNSPFERNPGHVLGKLVTIGDVTFVLEAKLAPPVRMGDRLVGRMEGLLTPHGRGIVDARPVAMVRGRYEIGPRGNGRFEAGFLRLERNADVAPKRIGRIYGLFHDQPDDVAKQPGRFLARWVICRP